MSQLEAGPKVTDQINLTDEESRIMLSHAGFVQAYLCPGQAAVDVDSMLIVAATLNAGHQRFMPCGYKQQVEPMLHELAKLPPELGMRALLVL